MQGLILNQTFETLAIVDTFESFIWTERYRGCGDFEIYAPVNMELLPFLKRDNYIMLVDTNYMMIIEEIEIKGDAEDGDRITITGRSLESILDRRVIWGQAILTGNLQNGIKKLLNENVISPSDSTRKIPNFRFITSTDAAVTSLTVDAQFFGDNLYEAIVSLCEESDIGFRVFPEGAGGFTFELFAGVDRSYDQDARPHVIFSPDFDNLLSSRYFESGTAYKTVALVAGEGEGAARTLVSTAVKDGAGRGLSRKEIYVDGSGVSKTVTDESAENGSRELTASEYSAQLKEKGAEGLVEVSITKAIEGEVDASRQFVYGEDFFLGDIVQVRNQYDMESVSRVSEIIRSHDVNGESVIPTFTTIEKSS